MLKTPHLFPGTTKWSKNTKNAQKCPKTPKNPQKRQNPPKPTVSSGFREIAKFAKIELGLLWDQNCQKPQKTHFLRGLAGPPKNPQKQPKSPKSTLPTNFWSLLNSVPFLPYTFKFCYYKK